MNRFILHSCLLLASMFFVASSSVTASDSSDSWESAESVGDGWYNLSWFGHYYAASDNWIYHVYHGWLYRADFDPSSIWLYDQELGWIWTSQAAYPFLYRHSTLAWLYYQIGTFSPRSFYDFDVDQWISVTVTEVFENSTPVFTSADAVDGAENQTVAATVVATDADQSDTPTYSLTGGTDQALFDLGAATGVLTFKAAPDFEIPGDADGKNTYIVEVTVSDGTDTAVQTLTVTVTNVNEAPTDLSLDNATIAENGEANAVVGSLTLADPDGSDDGDAHPTYALVAGQGDTDNVAFTVEGNELKLTAPADFEAKETYSVRVEGTDPGGLKFAKAFNVTVTEISLPEEENTDLADGLYAQIETSLGNMTLGLEFEKCPITVCNFVSLAEGTMTTERQGPYYDGLIFHRVINNFMIQGGDPLGTGGGGPGYSFRDEIDFSLLHTGKGVLSMANSGPSTNGSQFFITHAATSWLDGKHTVFGQVVDGMDVLDAIAVVTVDSSDKPTEPVRMNKVSIVRVGEKANSFETGQAAFDAYLQASHPNETAGENHLLETRAKDGYNVTSSGLVYKVIEEGTGNQASSSSLVTLDYEGRLIDGTVFDSSYDRGTPTSLYLNQVIAGFAEGVQLIKTGGTIEFHIPHNLAYGESNVGLVIPPFSTIIFTVELISFQ
jgi:peptidyl-prolyl cis-trans isomerase A (cyclophilin A)